MSIDLTKQYWTRDGDKVSNLFMLSTVFIFPLRGIITDSRGVAKEGQWTANGLHIPNQPTAMDLVDNNQLLFRHRSRSFDESMKTVVPINSMDDLLAELTKVIGYTPKKANVRIDYFGFDARILWVTHLISIIGEHEAHGILNRNFVP